MRRGRNGRVADDTGISSTVDDPGRVRSAGSGWYGASGAPAKRLPALVPLVEQRIDARVHGVAERLEMPELPRVQAEAAGAVRHGLHADMLANRRREIAHLAFEQGVGQLAAGYGAGRDPLRGTAASSTGAGARRLRNRRRRRGNGAPPRIRGRVAISWVTRYVGRTPNWRQSACRREQALRVAHRQTSGAPHATTGRRPRYRGPAGKPAGPMVRASAPRQTRGALRLSKGEGHARSRSPSPSVNPHDSCDDSGAADACRCARVYWTAVRPVRNPSRLNAAPRPRCMQ